MKLAIATVLLLAVGCSLQPKQTHTDGRTKQPANDPSSENAKPKSGGSEKEGESAAVDKDGFNLTENMLLTMIATTLGMKPEEVAQLRSLLATNRAAIKPLSDMITKLANKEVAAFVKGKFVEMSVHADILARVSYILGYTNADKSPIKSLRVDSDGVITEQKASIVTGDFVSFRAIATYADGSERDITNLVLWEHDAAADIVTQDSLSRYRLRGDKDGASGKFTAKLTMVSGEMSGSLSFVSRKAFSQTYEMFVEKNGEPKASLALGYFFKVKVIAKVIDLRGQLIAKVDKTDTTPVTMTQAGAEPHVIQSTVFGSPIYRSYTQGTQNFNAQVDGQQLSATLAITPAVELFKFISGSESYEISPFEECGPILKGAEEKSTSADDGFKKLVGDGVHLAVYSVLSTCQTELVEGVKFLPADVYVPAETPGYYVLGKVRSLDQVGSVTTEAGQAVTTLNKLANEVRAKELTAVVFSENLAEKIKCDRGIVDADSMGNDSTSSGITKTLYAVFNECRVESFDTSDSAVFEVTNTDPANILSIGALNYGQVEFNPNPARGSQQETVTVSMAVNLSSMCYPADTGCVASAQKTVSQTVIVPGAVPVDISYSENGLSCSFNQGKPAPKQELVNPGQSIPLSLFYTPLGTDSSGNCLAIPFTEAMVASTQLEVSSGVALTDWTLTAPQSGSFQVTARFVSGDTTLQTTRYFYVEQTANEGGDYEQVRPIFEERCQSCHNQVAPDLSSLQQIARDRDTILQSIVSGQMPAGSTLPSQEKAQLIGFLEGLSGEEAKVCKPNPSYINPKDRFDVSNDGVVTPLDVLQIINRLSALQNGGATEPHHLQGMNTTGKFYDVNGNGCIEKADAEAVINHLDQYDQVRPIFEARCQSCHNQVAPDLSSLHKINSNRDLILQSIVSGQMPAGGMLPSNEKSQLVDFLEGLSADGEPTSTSPDLIIKQTREDDQHLVKVDMIKGGAVVLSETFSSPGKDGKVVLRDFCSQASTCLKVTFIGRITQVAGDAECVFVAPQSDTTVKIDVDTNGAGIFGTCKPDEDETYYFSCPDSTRSLQVADCSN